LQPFDEVEILEETQIAVGVGRAVGCDRELEALV
jgi:hypothetical protein